MKCPNTPAQIGSGHARLSNTKDRYAVALLLNSKRDRYEEYFNNAIQLIAKLIATVMGIILKFS